MYIYTYIHYTIYVYIYIYTLHTPSLTGPCKGIQGGHAGFEVMSLIRSVQGYEPSAPEPRGNTRTGFKDVHLKATARIWP